MNINDTIKRCRKGDRKAQRALYGQFRSIWFTICLRYLREEQDAMDALQNGLVKIYSNLSSFDEQKGNFRNWSCRIVVNECLMLLRKNKADVFVSTGTIVDNSHAAPASALSEIGAREIVGLIQNLPDGYRTVFNLYAIEGYSHKEIADQLNITEGTSKSQLFKARQILQQHVKTLFETVYP